MIFSRLYDNKKLLLSVTTSHDRKETMCDHKTNNKLKITL